MAGLEKHTIIADRQVPGRVEQKDLFDIADFERQCYLKVFSARNE